MAHDGLMGYMVGHEQSQCVQHSGGECDLDLGLELGGVLIVFLRVHLESRNHSPVQQSFV